MTLNRPLALVVGILTIAPWAFSAYLFAHIASLMPVPPMPGTPADQFFQDFQSIFRLQLLFMLLMLALLAFYIFHVFRTTRVPNDKKALWAVVLFLGNLFAMPVYWYFYVWPREPDGTA